MRAWEQGTPRSQVPQPRLLNGAKTPWVLGQSFPITPQKARMSRLAEELNRLKRGFRPLISRWILMS